MKRIVALGAVLVLVLVIAACSSPTAAPPPPTSAPPVQPTAAPKPTEAPKATAASTAAPAAALPNLQGRAIRVGSDTTYPPFETVNDKKEIVGFDVDLVMETCKRLNCKATFQTADFSTIFTAVAGKQYDMAASGITITEDRKKTVDFGGPYIVNTQSILVRADETRIKSKDDLKNPAYVAGTQNGTSNEIAAQSLVADKVKQLKLYEDFSLAVAGLKNKAFDALVIDTFSAYGYLDDPANKGALKLAGEAFSTGEYLALAFQKGSDLVAPFDAALTAMLKDGTMTKFCEKWWPVASQRPDCSFKGMPQMK